MARALDTLVLVDGSNVIHSTPWIDIAGTDLHVRGERLVDACASFASLQGADIVVVFDGTGPYGTPVEQRVGARVTVVATIGNTADDWIEREASVCRASGRGYWIISSDGTLRS